MATSTKIWLTPENAGVFSSPSLSSASARKVSEVLQHDMENHHIYLNEIQFQLYRMLHFMLTIWALRATPETIQLQYEREDKRQRPAYLRDEKREIDAKGISAVLREYLFSGDKLVESLLSRMCAGPVHPIIHLGFGIEFQQPAIVAQALAQASVHQDYLADRFFNPRCKGGSRSLRAVKIYQANHERNARRPNCQEHTDVFEDGIQRASDEVIQHCSKWTVLYF
ncbi:hypothetical protein N7519_011401 [Penicillium mononematosum]|uniref:uncharacterized protein n=1 Tax=Penicillium mononematosum TaxID=268346 RepID=UPI0025482B2F|nr:uncharacterized protein N7519_011401 [Penicillium mononematosum]KAJ6180940.1 hypothetical protein N7519_011401 [Penicillium mononematosum]